MITTHVLDLSTGRPAAGVRVSLAGGAGVTLASATTDADGRVRDLLPRTSLTAGTYVLIFETGTYFGGRGIDAFHPRVSVAFDLRDATQHYHVPLLISPFGYTTYRGS